MEDFSTCMFETPDVTTDVKDKTTTDAHDALAGADGDGAEPMVSGALQAKEGGTPMKITESLSEASAADVKTPDSDEANPMMTMIVAERVDRLRTALETRRLTVDPPIYDSALCGRVRIYDGLRG